MYISHGGGPGTSTMKQGSGTIKQSINLVKAKGPNGHLHRSKIHDKINTHKHILLRVKVKATERQVG